MTHVFRVRHQPETLENRLKGANDGALRAKQPKSRLASRLRQASIPTGEYHLGFDTSRDGKGRYQMNGVVGAKPERRGLLSGFADIRRYSLAASPPSQRRRASTALVST